MLAHADVQQDAQARIDACAYQRRVDVGGLAENAEEARGNLVADKVQAIGEHSPRPVGVASPRHPLQNPL
ncbi:hypothetical protein D3C71_2228080 [compost metagenome]